LANQVLLKQSHGDSTGETATSHSIPDAAVTNVNDLMEGEVF
jgi:hypothetical protein